MKNKLTIAIPLLILFSLVFVGVRVLNKSTQGQTAPDVVRKWTAHTEYATVNVSATGDSARLALAMDSVQTWLENFQARYKTDGEIDLKVYNAKKGDTLLLDTEAYHLFQFALGFREFSHGDIDIGIGNLLRAWKVTWGTAGNVPPDSVRLALVEDLKTPFYSLDTARKAIVILKPQHHPAFGAFMEGEIMDRVEDFLAGAGSENWLIDVSGDFAYRGTKPGNQPWVLGVKDPAAPEELLATVRMLPGKRSFCTSGDYEQQFTDSKGVKHHHIFNPRTGESTTGKHSASVSTSIPGMNRNTLCTWFMVLPFDRIKQEIAESKGGIETVLVLDSNQVWISPGLRSNVNMLKDNYKLVQ